MSLNFDYSKIKDFETVCTDPHNPDEWATVTWALTLATMVIGFGRITEDNLYEFWRRLDLWQRNVTAFMHKNAQPWYFEFEDVRRHIGLSTNVTTMKDGEWNKHYKQAIERNRSDVAEHEIRQSAKRARKG
jgi:hypothetical protein